MTATFLPLFFICPLVSLPDNDRTWIFRGVKHEDIVADTVIVFVRFAAANIRLIFHIYAKIY